MITHHVSIGIQQGSAVTLATDLIRVTRADELPAALKQRAKSVVIENSQLERKFSWMEFWQGRQVRSGLLPF